jgi:hypothetical protein
MRGKKSGVANAASIAAESFTGSRLRRRAARRRGLSGRYLAGGRAITPRPFQEIVIFSRAAGIPNEVVNIQKDLSIDKKPQAKI